MQVTLYRINHIGQVVPELEAQVALLEGLFGFRQRQSWENAEEGCRGVLFDVPGSWGHRWEVLAPLGEDSPLQEFLDSPRGPGLHHVGVEVPNIEDAKNQIERLGIKSSVGGSSTSERWIDAPLSTPVEGGEGLLFRIFGSPARGTCGVTVNPETGASSGRAPGSGGEEAPSLGIVAIEQIGQAYSDRNELARWCERTLGMREVYRTPEGKHPDIATLIMNIPGTQMRWEIIQPVDEESFVQRFLDRRGPGAHHVTFEVSDWEGAMAACRHHEVPTFGENEGETDGARWCDTFIHPRYTGGILVQIFWEQRPGVWTRSDKIPRRSETE